MPKRMSVRLKNYDYSRKGVYFITICTHNKSKIFGDIYVGATGGSPIVILNKYGNIVKNEWLKTPKIRNEIILDEFIIMPDHMHMIVKIAKPPIENELGDPPVFEKGDPPVAPTLMSKSIGSLMSGYKSIVSIKINKIRNTPGKPIWQRNYYERIIRNASELIQIRNYIHNNPKRWE